MSPQNSTPNNAIHTPPTRWHAECLVATLDKLPTYVHYPVQMTAITYTAARENLASTMDKVCLDHDPVIITRNRDQAVVMLSLEDYESLQETAYLLRSPTNAKRLIASIESLNSGRTVKKSLKDLAEA